MFKVGDYIKTKPTLGKGIFGRIKKVEELDGGYFAYLIDAPDGEYTSYGPELLTKKEAKELIKVMQNNIEFLKKV